MFCFIQRNRIINLLRKRHHMILLSEGNEWHWVTVTRFCKATLAVGIFWNFCSIPDGWPVFSICKLYLSRPRLTYLHFNDVSLCSQEECWAGRGKLLRIFKDGLSVQMLPESINTQVFSTCGRNSNIFVCYIFGPLNLEYFVTFRIALFPRGKKT